MSKPTARTPTGFDETLWEGGAPRPVPIATYTPTIENKPGTVAGAFSSVPRGVILHSSRSGSGNDTAAEYRGTVNYAASGIELGWNATIGDDIYAVHMDGKRWGWNARAASQTYLAVEFAQATADKPISDAQVNAFCHWFMKQALVAWPGLPLVFPTHAELPEGQADGKSDVFPIGDPRADELRARILARLGFSAPPAGEGEGSVAEPPAATGPAAPPPGGKLWDGVTRFTLEPDVAFTLAQLLPVIQRFAERYGVDWRILAGMVQQESTYHNYRVHRDGTGHGLVGLDDNGLAQDFMAWSGITVARGGAADIIPVEAQLEFMAYQVRKYQDRYTDDGPYVGARAWHAGGKGRNNQNGQDYERLVKERIVELGL